MGTGNFLFHKKISDNGANPAASKNGNHELLYG
jgi:hypothetical protein